MHPRGRLDPAVQRSPGEPVFASEQLLQQSPADDLGLPPLPGAQPAANGTQAQQAMPGGYMSALQQPQEAPSLRQLSAGGVSVSSGERWAGYDASGSNGALRSGSNGSAVAAAAAVSSWIRHTE